MTTETILLSTIEARLEKKRQEHQRELDKFEAEETLRDELKSIPLIEDAFIHQCKYNGVDFHVTLRTPSASWHSPSTLTEAIEALEAAERLAPGVTRLRCKEFSVHYMTEEFYNALPEEKQDKLEVTRLLPVMIKLSKFGNDLIYYGKTASGKTIEFSVRVGHFAPFIKVDYTYNKKTLIDCRVSGSAWNIHDDEGNSLGQRVVWRQYSSDKVSEEFNVAYEQLWEDATKMFSISNLRNWKKEE